MAKKQAKSQSSITKKTDATSKSTSPRVKQSPKIRKLKQADYKSFRLTKRKKHPGPRLSSSLRLFKTGVKHLWQHKKLFTGISLVYLVITVVLVRGFVFTGDLTLAKDAIAELFSGAQGQLVGSIAVFGVLLESASPSGQVAAVYQSLIAILFSLILIWTLRQTQAGEKVTFQDAFYKSTYPLIQFILVLLMVGIQTIPFIIGGFLYGATIASGFSTSFAEILAWSSLVFLLMLWSIYLITSSMFALFIVTLPDMTPRRALRSAKALVQYRRWTVMRKVLVIPLFLMIIAVVVMLPVIFLITPAAEITFLLLGSFALPVVISYVYSLYRELLA